MLPLRSRAIAAMLLLLLGGCAGNEVARAIVQASDAAPHPGVARAHRLPVQGIDVSHHQGAIDWPAVRRAGIRFAYIKVAEGGDHVDKRFYDNWDGAARAGIPRGAYHFMYWCRTAVEQAIWFSKAVPQDFSALPPVLDLEWNNHSKTCRRTVPRQEALEEIRMMLDAMEAHTGKRPVIYTDINFHRDVLEGELRGYEFWLRSVAAEPHERFAGRPWHFWQYTATGRVPGIKGDVDRNAFHGSERDWQRWLQRHSGDMRVRKG